MEGCLKLGMISSTKRNFEEGKENFRRALELAEQTGNQEVYDEAKFGYAVVAAEKGMNNFLGYYSSKLGRRGVCWCDILMNEIIQLSDEFFFLENFLEGSITLSGGSNESRDSDDVGFGVVNGSVGVDLSGERCTSQTDSWTEEWSLEVTIRSVKSHLRGR